MDEYRVNVDCPWCTEPAVAHVNHFELHGGGAKHAVRVECSTGHVLHGADAQGAVARCPGCRATLP